MYKILISFCALIIFGMFFMMGKSLVSKNTSTPKIQDKKNIAFEVPLINLELKSDTLTKTLKSNDLIGHPIVVNFWSSWCLSCRSEAQVLQKFWTKYKDKGVKVVGISIQDNVLDIKNIANFLKKTYPIGIDLSGGTAIDYGVTGVPETYFLDQKGYISYKHTGPLTWDILEKKIKQIM